MTMPTSPRTARLGRARVIVTRRDRLGTCPYVVTAILEQNARAQSDEAARVNVTRRGVAR